MQDKYVWKTSNIPTNMKAGTQTNTKIIAKGDAALF
jgi:hypothetical protein